MTKRIPWSREELDFLSEHYMQPGWNSERIQREKPGPHRSISAIRQKARYIGLASLDQRGNWQHDPKLYDDIYDMAVLDYTQEQIAYELKRQHGVTVTGEWVSRTMKKRLPAMVHKAWASRQNERRAEGVSRSWLHRRRAA